MKPVHAMKNTWNTKENLKAPHLKFDVHFTKLALELRDDLQEAVTEECQKQQQY